jgi:hypothetical protein
MMLTALGQAMWSHATSVLDAVALAPTPTPAPKSIDTSGVLEFFGTKIAPILLAVLGVIFIGRASRGEISKVLTSSAIAIIGLAFIAGAGVLLVFGGSIIDLLFE